MHSLTLTIPIADGKLKLSDYQQSAIDKFCEKLQHVTLKLTRPGSLRSLQQNSFYWQVLTIIARETGNDTESLHEYAKMQFLPKMFVKLGTKEVELQKSTTKLSPKEMGDYITRVIAFAGELGILIPQEMP